MLKYQMNVLVAFHSIRGIYQRVTIKWVDALKDIMDREGAFRQKASLTAQMLADPQRRRGPQSAEATGLQ